MIPFRSLAGSLARLVKVGLFVLRPLCFGASVQRILTVKPKHPHRQPEMLRGLVLCALLAVVVNSIDIAGVKTTYEIITPGSGAKVTKGATVTVHATGTVKETNKKFWSTKDAGQKPFTYQVAYSLYRCLSCDIRY